MWVQPGVVHTQPPPREMLVIPKMIVHEPISAKEINFSYFPFIYLVSSCKEKRKENPTCLY
jgi:hypothetical protein